MGRTILLAVAAVQTRARLGQLAADEQQIWADLRAQFEASANGTRFLYEEDQRAWARDHRPQFNVSRILQDETPAPTVKGKEDHCPRCWWRKSPPDPDHWWPAMTTTQRNGIGPVRWEGQVGGAERMSCPVGWGQVNKDNIRLRVEKKWERVCFYCWKAKLSDARDMERLIAHTTWDEQQYYRLFYIWGCGGMFGTPRFAAPGGCEKKSIEFGKTFKISTYLYAVVAGPYSFVEHKKEGLLLKRRRHSIRTTSGVAKGAGMPRSKVTRSP